MIKKKKSGRRGRESQGMGEKFNLRNAFDNEHSLFVLIQIPLIFTLDFEDKVLNGFSF